MLKEDFYKILICPITGEGLKFDPDRNVLYRSDGSFYNINNGVPCLLPSDIQKAK